MTYKTEIIAHRGASYDAPENTLAAMLLAWEQQADGAECDVYVTTDNEVVLLHDPTLLRTGGVDIDVSKSDLATVRSADVGLWKGNTWKGEKVPTLAEVFPAIAPGKKLVIEIKGGVQVVPAMVQAIKSAEAKGVIKRCQLEFISFNEDSLRAAKNALPECKSLYLSGNYKNRSSEALDELIQLCIRAGFDGLDLDKKWPIDPAFVDRLHKAGLRLYAWTVNEPDRALELAKSGIDAITTDRPALIRSALE